MTKVVLPRLNQTGVNEWADVQTNDEAIATVVNSEITNENLSGAAGITDANIASPNNSAYRALFTAMGNLGNGSGALAAGTFFICGSSSTVSAVISPATLMVSGFTNGSTIGHPPCFNLASADHTVAGKTAKLQLRAALLSNATKPALKFTYGLYPVTTSGPAGTFVLTLGTVVAGSTVEINEPAASTVTRAVTAGDFTLPADGLYTLGVVTNATLTNNNVSLLHAELQIRYV